MKLQSLTKRLMQPVSFLIYFFGITSGILSASCASSSQTDSQSDTKSARLVEVYRRINSNWSYTGETEHVGRTDSWKELTAKTANGTTSMVAWDFQKQPSFTAALNEIISSKLIMECSNAARIARLALLNSVLEDKGMHDWALSLLKKNSCFDLMSELSWKFFEKSANDDTLGKFYAYPFVNLPEYASLKDGPDGNHNIVRLPDGLYVGFAPDFFTEPRTHDDLVGYLFNKFTSTTDIRKGKEAEHARFCTWLTLEKFKQIRAAYQAKVGYFVFNPKS